jgi:tetratricopeptide (TPR) repeat protein
MKSRSRSAWYECLLCLAIGCATASPVKLTTSDTVMLADLDDSTGSKLQRPMREALRVALDESPYLNLVPDAAIERPLQETGGDAGPEKLGRICRAAASKVYVHAALAAAPQGAPFRGELEAVDCASGARIAREPFTALQTGLIDALGDAAARLRLDLGEPRDSVQSARTPLSRAASGSLEALAAWSSALSVWRKEGPAAALPALDKAVSTDPAFIAATYDLGLAYRNSGQEERARELFTRAFAQRERASTRRRLNIAAQYHAFVTVDEKHAVEAFSAWIGEYPRDYKAVSNLGSFYGDICRYPEAIAQFERARQMNPTDVVAHEDLMEMLTAVGEFHKAREVYRDIVRLKLDDDSPHLYLYVIAALENNSAEMAEQAAWFADKKELRHEILSEQADAAAYAGNLERARALTGQAVAAAREAGNLEQAAGWLLNSAWREDLAGNPQLAHDQALQALSIAPASREGEATAAIILARTGDRARAEALIANLEQRYPDHSVMQSYWLPTIRAQLALKRGDSATALQQLTRAAPLDLLYPQIFFYSHMPSVVLRAEAYRLAGDGARAAEQWQLIVRNPGITQLSATAPYARVQLATASGARS